VASFQGSLFGSGPATPRLFQDPPSRLDLGAGAWVDVERNWLTGADDLFLELVNAVPWEAERRPMYDRIVDVPRLHHFFDEESALPHPALDVVRRALDDRYAADLGEPFATAGCCLYRDGADSVAWHGDRIGRSASADTIVAILSLGAPRRFLLRPNPDRGDQDGRSVAFTLASGDLLVMGGSCQRTFEHSVPKTRHAPGPRVSVQFRARDVR
jgi:alkylated DNA repair dioxygenase AlkB